MKKYLLTLIFILICGFSMAQNNCQEIVQLINSNSIEATIETDPITGEVTVYYDLCLGETLSLEASAEFPENNTTYFQSVANTSFTWYMDEALESNLQNFTHTFDDAGGYIVSLYAEDTNGCITPAPVNVFVRVGTTPTINLSVSPSTVCPGVVTNIGAGGTSDISFSAVIETGSWESLPCEDEFSEPLYLPDGSGAVYQTNIVLACFGEGQLLTNVNDIISLDINMEHSYSGDLDIYITAPNGVQVTLFEQAGGGTWFGEATDGDATATNPGIGYDYGWSMNPTYNGTMADGITNNTSPPPAGGFGNILNSDIYLPIGDFDDFLGTPLNGTWTITVVDNLMTDNGWIFSWGISINQNIIPSSWSFDNYIVEEYFSPEPSIISNIGTSINIQPEPGTYNYSYEVVDNFGCIFSEEVTVTATSYINAIEEVTNEYCGGDDGEISLQISGGTPDYSVAWNSGTTGATLNNLSEGTYFYTITDDLDCEVSGNATIENGELGLLFDTEINNDQCDQGIGQISLTPLNGSSPYTFNWSNSNPNQNMANNLFAGDYQINIIDNQGCEGDLLIELNNIFIDIDEDGICDELEPIEGCTYQEALNYNEEASIDDGSCIFEFNVSFEDLTTVTTIVSIYNIYTVNLILGTTQIAIGDLVGVFYLLDGVLVSGGYIVYDGTSPIQIAVIGDDPTTPEVEGFQDGQEIIWIVQQTETQTNYLIDVVTEGEVFTQDTEEVVILEEVNLTVVLGCTDPLACNYNPDANLEDGSCKYPVDYIDCNGDCLNDFDMDGECDEVDYDDGIGIDEVEAQTPQLLKMIDVLGREQKEHKKGMVLFYVYDNGKIEKKIIH